MTSPKEVKKVTIADVIFFNEENGYTVAVAETREEQFTCVGCLPASSSGRTYELEGEWKMHPTYGEQFAFTSFKEIMPETESGIEAFLGSGVVRGVGQKTAAAIVQRFGKETLEIIEKCPERLLEVPGIGESKMLTIADSFRTQREFAEVSMYFANFGISAEMAMRIYREYGSVSIEVAKTNPYQMVKDVPGIGFRRADAMAIAIGMDKNDEFRIRSGIEFTLFYYAGEGHVYVPEKELCEKTAGLLDVASDEVHDQLVDMVFDGELHMESIEGRSVVYLMTYYKAESNVVQSIKELSEYELMGIGTDIYSLIRKTEIETGIELSERQKQAVITSIGYGVSVITGGPGTGKTTIINAIINVLKDAGYKVAIAAPTGRAAKRITETSGHFAQTVHRLLDYYYSPEDETMKFGKNQEDMLDYNAIIIDEASMMDILLMNGLMNAIKPGTRLILVGDADQLPSVGAGNVLRDLIDSEYVYVVGLTEIFRQAQESLIVVNAHRINRGEYPSVNDKEKDFFFMRKPSDETILQTIKDLYRDRLPAYYKGIEAVKDIQVLTPVKKGTIGVHNLNKELQELVNPAGPGKAEKKLGERVFRVGDKVMQIKNNYEMEWRKLSDMSDGTGVFNGELGYVNSIDNEFNTITVVFDEDKYATYDYTTFDELELAYAVTVHKSQGSEFSIVIMPISWFPPVLATRNLLYTAVTRGKQVVVLVGDQNKMEQMIDNNRITQRYSGLGVKLNELLKDKFK